MLPAYVRTVRQWSRIKILPLRYGDAKHLYQSATFFIYLRRVCDVQMRERIGSAAVRSDSGGKIKSETGWKRYYGH